MRRGLVCLAFLLAPLAAAEDSLHVYYYGGESIEQINIGGVTVTLTLKDNGKLNQGRRVRGQPVAGRRKPDSGELHSAPEHAER